MVKAAVELVIVDFALPTRHLITSASAMVAQLACGNRNPLIMPVRNPALKDSSV